jgi:hypothetical protein
MKLFRRVPLTFFTPERARELSKFAEKADEFARDEGSGADYLVDMFSSDEAMWSDFLQEAGVKAHNPLVNTRGNLDVLAACIAEGTDIAQVWDNVSFRDYERMQKDLARAGLHGLHFRMGLNNSSDRIDYTFLLAEQLYKIDEDAFRYSLNAQLGLSTFRDRRSALSGYLEDQAANQHAMERIMVKDVELLLDGAEGADVDQYNRALRILLREDDRCLADVTRSVLARRIENAFMPLVYNYGYRLKAQGLSNEEVSQKASANIDALLQFLELEPQVQHALKRQVLINLFSPFPEGLELLGAKAEELQGVILDPALIDCDDANRFGNTLLGPLQVFGVNLSVHRANCSAQLIGYFNDSPYTFDFETAIHGRLAKSELIVDLFTSYCDGHSQYLDQALSGDRPEVFVHESLLSHLLHKDRIGQYSDRALVALVSRTISHIKAPGTSSSIFFAKNSAGIGHTLKSRPHLVDATLELLVENEALTREMFTWCGFDHRELKKLGRHASSELKQHVLLNEMGL